MKKILLLLLSCLCIATAVSACSGKDKSDKETTEESSKKKKKSSKDEKEEEESKSKKKDKKKKDKDKDKKKKKETEDSDEETSETEEPETFEETDAEETTMNFEINSGEIYRVGDTLNMNGVEISFKNVIESKGGEFMAPEAGNVYVFCEFDIANNSSAEYNISSIVNFSAYCDDYAVDINYSALMAPESSGKSFLDGTIPSGKKLNGVLAYEVPENWQNLELRFAPDIFTDDFVIFMAEK